MVGAGLLLYTNMPSASLDLQAAYTEFHPRMGLENDLQSVILWG
jgi:hypothetical protein